MLLGTFVFVIGMVIGATLGIAGAVTSMEGY